MPQQGFLGTRRLKLFLLAHLRGLLKPDYPQGLTSILRENFILEGIENEMDVDIMKTFAQVNAGFASALNTSNIKDFYTSQTDKLQNIRGLMEFQEPVVHKPKDVDLSIKLYHALEEANLL
jgi:hypothetical protein